MVCRQKLNASLHRKPKHRSVKVVNRESDATEDESTEDEDPIFKIEEVSTVRTQGKQLLTKLQFLNQSEQFVTEIECQLDTGATCNVMSCRDLASICQAGEPLDTKTLRQAQTIRWVNDKTSWSSKVESQQSEFDRQVISKL